MSGCENTPYDNAEEAYEDWAYDPESKNARNVFRKAAQAEVDFLISLRVEAKEDAA